MRKKYQSLLMVIIMVVGLITVPQNFVGAATASGFYINGTTLYDANGVPFVMRGICYPHTFYKDQASKAFPAMAKTGANTVRIVLSDGQQFSKDDANSIKNLIALCEQYKMIAVIEIQDVTGMDDQAKLMNVVNNWIAMKDVLIGKEKTVILNIANEWYGTWNGAAWADGYKKAIPALRTAGIKNTLMVDSAGWGQYPQSIFDYGNSVFNSDVLKNTMFSIHMYEYAGAPGKVKENIDGVLNKGLALCIGEFGIKHTDGDVDEATIMSYSKDKSVGYLAWSWFGNGDTWKYLDMSIDSSGSSYTEQGNIIINDANGIKATSKICTVYPLIVDDTEPPTTPTNLSSTAKTAISVTLNWTAATDNVGVAGYDIYKGTTLVGSTAGTSYKVSGLTASTPYSFTLKAKDAAGNVSNSSSAINVTTDVESSNLALGKTATASSKDISGREPSVVCDGDDLTRWSSLYTDNEWITVDLGTVKPVNAAKLIWEAAYGKEYKIQVSNTNNGTDWKEVYSTTTGNGGVEDITFTTTNVSARYVKMLGVKRATTYGYSLFEFEVYGPTIPQVIVGDLNDDKIVDLKDCQIMKTYLLYSKVTVDMSIWDINKDGKINILDYVLLKKIANK